METRLAAASARVEQAGAEHVSVAVPLRAAERSTHVAAAVLAGGFAYRLFFWLLAFGLLAGGVLGFADVDTSQDAIEAGGVPGLVSDLVGDVVRESASARWWLVATGLWLLLWTGYVGAKALRLIHALVWNVPPSRSRSPLVDALAFSGVVLSVMASIAVGAWLREILPIGGLIAAALALAPLVGLWLFVSTRLPHRATDWLTLLPGATVFAVGIEVLHVLTTYLLLPKLDSASDRYGGLGLVATLLFWLYLIGWLVVFSPVVNSALADEREQRRP